MKKTSFLKSACALLPALSASLVSYSSEVAHFTMQSASEKITEAVSGMTYAINGVHAAENVPGAQGKALRFDGYSTYIDASVGNIIPAGSKKMTASVWLAVETYPIVEIDVKTDEQVAVATCLNESERSGFGFFVGMDGRYSFKTYVSGWPLELKVDTPIERYLWVNLTAVVDAEERTATLYNNGVPVATSRANGDLKVTASTLRIGRSLSERYSGPFCLTSFNGLIDDITVWDEALTPQAVAAMTPENQAVLTVSADRFADDVLRPSYHGMPGANWTNETHGLTYYNGRYHLFFQKNANGPYMSRLHWGHLSSDNLCDWTEEPTAIAPDTSFDIKGCWSGCVFSDDQLTGGRPSIVYTGVDYGKAVIAQADPADDDLISWVKRTEPIINGRPDGLSDDFRDPYFFRTDRGAYIIVGSSKGGVGTTTLHAYNPATRTWSNDGRTFFTGTNASSCGTFWEMPNITKIGNKWLFTVTPQNTAKGVAALYWVGGINADGTFSPDKTNPATIELSGMARDGYGLLSPTVYQHNGKTIALGIVPDKLPSQDNYDLGYAHTYSLPREWSIDAQGNLCQKPFEGLKALRKDNGYSKSGFTLDGNVELDGIEGRAVEVCGEFTVSSGKCGFTLLDNGTSALKVYYDGLSNEIVVDARALGRKINDAGSFDGFYHSALPRQLAKGETLKLNVFFDHSILDIFINDTWASSVRVFADARSAEKVTAFADAASPVQQLSGWNLRASNGGSGITAPSKDDENLVLYSENGMLTYATESDSSVLAIYDITGRKAFEVLLESRTGSIPLPLRGMHVVTLLTPGGTIAKKLILR